MEQKIILVRCPSTHKMLTFFAHNQNIFRGRDSIAIPTSNYSLFTMDGWFVISFSRVPTKNAKPFKPLLGRETVK